MDFLPSIFKFNDGTDADTKEKFLLRREEMLDILAREEYGVMPERKKASGKLIKRITKCACGYAVEDVVEITIPTPNGDFTFPIHHLYPVKEGKHPTFVYLHFRGDIYSNYCPAEEIVERGFSVAIFNYLDIATDDGDFNNGISTYFPRTGKGDEWGKIGMWAYAASAVADYLLTCPQTDESLLGVIGHSRLGKTALWCGANDERFKFVVSNDSGCGGAAYEQHRSPDRETNEKICNVFPYWFCENYKKHVNDYENRCFDQHFLLASICPRYLLVGSASEDLWADPIAEEMSCVASSPAWDLFNKKGYIPNSSDGSIHYHIRPGIHFLGRPDWNTYMDFIMKKKNEKDFKNETFDF